METRHAATARTRPRRRRRRTALWVVLALALGLLAVALLTAWQARTAYAHLTAASERIPQLRQQVVAGEDEAARATVNAFREDTAAARDAVHGPHWSLLAALPEVGPNVTAVQTVTEVVDDLAQDALPQLMEATAVLDPANLAPRNGRVDLGPIAKAAPHINAAHAAVADADELLETIDTEPLLEPLRAPVTELSTTLDQARSLTETAAKAARLLPSMLGADEPRKYLLLTQNNSEPRALGGLPGAAIVLRADEGRIKLVKHQAASALGSFPEPVMKLRPAERALYGTQLGRYLINVTATPDFPRAAELARKMWRVATGEKVDGVATVDPYALQLLLRASGPVALPTGQKLTGDNAAEVLLNQTYIDMPDPAAQDAFFAVAAAAIFDKVMSGSVDLQATVKALAKATEQGRLMVWSAHEKEQAVIVDTPLSGALRGKHDGAPVVGVYVHDRSGAKIAYYEHLEVKVRPTKCYPDGSKDLRAKVTVSSVVPAVVENLPDYLTGGGWVVPAGHIRTDVLLYAPAGGTITEVRSSSGSDGVTTHVHDGLHVAEKTILLAPKESVTLTYDIRSPGSLPEPVELRVTPLATPGHVSTLTSKCN